MEALRNWGSMRKPTAGMLGKGVIVMARENLDYELASMEWGGETEAEWIDQETELFDYEGDLDEIFGPDATEDDLEHAYASFMSHNEDDYDGWNEGKEDWYIDEYEQDKIERWQDSTAYDDVEYADFETLDHLTEDDIWDSWM